MEKNYEAQSKAVRAMWNDEKRRKVIIAHMKESWEKRRKHKDITVSESEDYRAYQREYQRKYRLTHMDYYRKKARDYYYRKKALKKDEV